MMEAMMEAMMEDVAAVVDTSVDVDVTTVADILVEPEVDSVRNKEGL